MVVKSGCSVLNNRKPVRIIWTELSGAVQGHSLLATRLRDTAEIPAIGYKHSVSQRLLLKASAAFCRLTSRRTPNFQEVVFGIQSRIHRNSLFHFIWGDEVVGNITRPEQAIVTVHQPMELWSDYFWASLKNFRGVLCMAEREAQEVLARYPGLCAEFIPHGVDTKFWAPNPTLDVRHDEPVICSVGRYMRNFPMLVRVAERMLQRHPRLTFRWVVNPGFELPRDLELALPKARFQLLRNLSPEDLRSLYRQSVAMFMPYNNVTASNAIVEALTTGTPIVTTDVGGMRSYAGAGVDLVENNSDDAAIACLERLLINRGHRERQSAAARSFAERTMNWDYVVHRHLIYYSNVLRGRHVPVSPDFAERLAAAV
ncbi:hypothetical protein DB347_23820 [Opitutaceae bacterium EW11]|nr:hypothetical protein DB347_23820 [Opitutaceae bacterium EW11]